HVASFTVFATWSVMASGIPDIARMERLMSFSHSNRNLRATSLKSLLGGSATVVSSVILLRGPAAAANGRLRTRLSPRTMADDTLSQSISAGGPMRARRRADKV